MSVTAAACTFFFKGPSGYGWSERYWYTGTTTDPTFSANINALVNARMGLSTTNVVLNHIRVQSSTKRAVFVFALTLPLPTGTQPTPTAESEVALIMRLNGSGVTPVYNRIFMRGIPTRIISGDDYAPDIAYQGAVTAYSNVLATPNWAVVGTLGAPFPPSPVSITALTPLPPRSFSFAGPAASFIVGDQVRIKGNTIPGYGGIKTVTAISVAGTTYTVGGASPPVPDTGTAVTAQKVNRDQHQVSFAVGQAITRRGAGRPFGVSRGRKETLYSLRR